VLRRVGDAARRTRATSEAQAPAVTATRGLAAKRAQQVLTIVGPVRNTRNMPSAAKRLGWCSLTILVALYIVGAVSHGSLRHEVQTLPLWFPIVQGLRARPMAKWMALPCLVFWLVIMILIWLFLLG